jgi:exonuclease III
MRILCWNCRGLGSDATVGELRWLVRVHRPSLLFLSETKMRDNRVRSFMWSLGYSGCYAVSSVGLSGGLALFWLSSVSVTIKPCNARCIDVHITPDNGIKWRATFVYGEPRREYRLEFWDFLRFMRAHWDGPWICCGDFNEVLSQDEHLGPRDRTEA